MTPLQLIRAFQNPQQFLQQAIGNSEVMQNSMAANAVTMMQNGNTKGVEELARNMCKQRGINVDDAVNQLRKQLGM